MFRFNPLKRLSVTAALVLAGLTLANASSANVFGMQADGVVYHLDGGQSASFVYLCVNGDCRTATKANGRYERSFSPVNAATSYSLEFKIQDNATGQCITNTTVKPGESVASTPCFKGVITTSSTAITPSSIPKSSVAPSSIPRSSVAPSSIPKSSVTPPSSIGNNGAILPLGFHQIINKNSNKCVDVSGVSTANGAAIQLWDCLQNQQNQQWQFVATDSGFYRFVARHSGKLLDVSGVSTANGAQLHQWDWVGGQNQQWKAVDVGGGHYKFVARHSGRVIDVPNCNSAKGTQLQQWDDYNNTCQAFRIVAVDTPTPITPTIPASTSSKFGIDGSNMLYHIKQRSDR